MDEDELVMQMGLMLTQLRYARRALEDIERSTARYAGFAFASALQAGPAFGAPPLMDGALKVYVVNINDLAPGTGSGGFLESLLGGVGRFFGGLIGGFVGGTISGFNLPGIIFAMQDLAKRIEQILKMLGISFTADKDKKKDQTPTPTLTAQFEGIKKIVDTFTALFIAGSSPDKAGDKVKPETEAGVQWLAILNTAKALVDGISRVITGLIILIPTLIGALAWVIVHLRDIQKEVLGLLQFLLKEIFLLRGVLLFTLWDTIAGAAHLGASVLATLKDALATIIIAIGGIFTKIFDAALAILRFIAEGLKRTVDTLLRWLVDTVGAVLIALGDSKIFRVVVYLVQILPAVLPPLLVLLDKPVVDTDRTALQEAAKKTIEGPKITGKLSDLIPAFPDIKETLAPKTEIGILGAGVQKAFEGVQADLKKSFDASIESLHKIGKQLDEVKNDKSFLEALDAKEALLRERSKTLADTLTKAQEQLAARPDTGLEKIATAYEDWVKGGGMNLVLGQITTYFKESPDTGAFRPPMPPAAVDRPRATVEIKELLIEIKPSSEKKQGPSPEDVTAPLPLERSEPDHISMDKEHEMIARGLTLAPGARATWG